MYLKFVIVILISLLTIITIGFVLAGCKDAGCIGNGECTITIAQGAAGLYVDTSAPRSSCANAEYNYDTGKYTGCKVSIMNRWQNSQSRYGTHNCDCK